METEYQDITVISMDASVITLFALVSSTSREAKKFKAQNDDE